MTKNDLYPTTINGVMVKQYALWADMKKRCKPNYPRAEYHGCSVSLEFQSYPFFHDWCLEQIGFGVLGSQLDKDILIKGNKLYSPDTCVFVPQRINQLLTTRRNHRGDYPIGVTMRSGRYYSRFFVDGKQEQKSFTNVDDAFQFYKTNKELIIKQTANDFKSCIDPRVYDALMSYTIDIGD